jgi:hypothetical protein
VVAGVVGAWFDWIWWEPYNGIVITLLGGLLLVLGFVVGLVPRSLVRSIGLVVAGLGAGLLLGQNLGPARELPTTSHGTMTVRLTSPLVAEATSPATCSSTSDARNVAIFAESPSGMRLVDGYAASPSLRIGDMWRPQFARPDGLEIGFLLHGTGPIADDGMPTEVYMISNGASALTPTLDGLSGVVEFAQLVRNERYQTPIEQADPIDLAGTIEFSCEPPTSDG